MTTQNSYRLPPTRKHEFAEVIIRYKTDKSSTYLCLNELLTKLTYISKNIFQYYR